MEKETVKLRKVPTNHCAAPNCSNTTTTTNVTFHNFPGNRAIKEKWKAFCGTDYSDYLCKKYMLCSAHFNPNCFHSDSNSSPSNTNSTLKENAVPTIETPTQIDHGKLNLDQNQKIEPYPQNESRCRICLTVSIEMENIFSGDELNYANKIEQCVQINVRKDDNLPQNICIECIQLLENACKFKILCEQSNQILKLELINRTQLIKSEIPSNENEINVVDNQTISIKEEYDQQFNELESSSDMFHDDNIEQSDYDESGDISNTVNDTSDRIDDHIKERVTSPNKFNDNSRKKWTRKTKSDCYSGDECDDSRDSDWMDLKDISKKAKIPKEIKVQTPKHIKIKVKVRKGQNKPKKIQCEECGYITVGVGLLEDHKRAVHQGITDFYKCQLCPKKFKRQSFLKCHINNMHDFNSVVCDTCGKTFKNKCNLYVHRKTTHADVKKFKCDYCPYMAATNSAVTKHKSIHTGERKYECQICKTTFRASGTLVSHVKSVHQNIRPFKCKMCEKGFSSRLKLQKHSVVHTGIKPYSCPICPNMTYSWYFGLKLHQRSLHPDIKLETENILYKKFIRENNLSVFEAKRNKAIKEKWKAFCGTDYSDYLCKKYMLCSAHFNPDCFHSDGNSSSSNTNSTLKENAVPSIETPTQINLGKLTGDENKKIEPDPQNESRCRICLTVRRRIEMENIFSGEELNYANKIEQCVQINVREDDNLPQNICIPCVQLLGNAYKFKILCEQSNQILKLELINRTQLIKSEIPSNENEINLADNQKISIEQEYDQQFNELESSSDMFHNNIGYSDCDTDDSGDISNTLNDTNDRIDDHIKETVTNPIKFNESSREKWTRKTKSDSDSVDDCDNSRDNDWTDPEDISKKAKIPKEIKVQAPKEIKIKVKRLRKRQKGTKPKKIQCEECGYITICISYLEDHKRAVHQGITDFYKCQLCPKAFPQKHRLQSHMNHLHCNNSVVCDTCGKTFKNKYNLYFHRASRHLPRKYKCDFCPYVAATYRGMEVHKSVHTGERKYQCQFCKITYRTDSALTTHIKGVHKNIRPFKCKLCEKSFKNKSTLRKHSVVHTGFKPFSCPICLNVKYSWYVGLTSHQRALHPDIKLETENTLYQKFIQENNLSDFQAKSE